MTGNNVLYVLEEPRANTRGEKAVVAYCELCEAEVAWCSSRGTEKWFASVGPEERTVRVTYGECLQCGEVSVLSRPHFKGAAQ